MSQKLFKNFDCLKIPLIKKNEFLLSIFRYHSRDLKLFKDLVCARGSVMTNDFCGKFFNCIDLHSRDQETFYVYPISQDYYLCNVKGKYIKCSNDDVGLILSLLAFRTMSFQNENIYIFHLFDLLSDFVYFHPDSGKIFSVFNYYFDY